MYNAFFQLREKPFAIEPNPRFIILDDDHREALATLVYAIEQQEGWALLLGEAGTGKTTLIISLLRQLPENVIAAVITNPRLSPLDFFNMLALELGMDGPYATKGQFLSAFGQYFNQCRAQNKIILLVVDEAHLLSPDMMEELRLLSNLDNNAKKTLNIFLVGQTEFANLLKKIKSTGLLQRIRHYHLLKALSEEDTKQYIRHRLIVAGGNPDIFSSKALGAIFNITNGNPRLINTLCDAALLVALTKDQPIITPHLIYEAAQEEPSLNWRELTPARPIKTLSLKPMREQPSLREEIKPIPESNHEYAFKNQDEIHETPLSEEPETSLIDEPIEETRYLQKPESSKDQAITEPLDLKSQQQEEDYYYRFEDDLDDNEVERKKSKSSFFTWKKISFAVLLLFFITGGVVIYAKGGIPYLRYKWKALTSDETVEVVVPEERLTSKTAKKEEIPRGVKDWGPIVKVPLLSPHKGGSNG